MTKNREEAVRRTREFLRNIREEYDGRVVVPRLASAKAIHAALSAVKLSDDIPGEITFNMIVTALRPHSQETGSKANWTRLISAVCSFQLHSKSKLFKLQSEIRSYADNRDDDRNDIFVNLFKKDKESANYDSRLIGAFVVYRQVTDSSNTEKAILVIDPIAASTGMRFKLIRCDDRNRYFMAEGRVLCLRKSYMLIGGIYNPNGFQSDGAALISLSRVVDETETGINSERMNFSPGIHSICADFVTSCSTKILLIRLEESIEKEILEVAKIEGPEGVRDAADLFSELEYSPMSLSFDEAVLEIMDRTSGQISESTIISAISNETTPEDTLHQITTLT